MTEMNTTDIRLAIQIGIDALQAIQELKDNLRGSLERINTLEIELTRLRGLAPAAATGGRA